MADQVWEVDHALRMELHQSSNLNQVVPEIKFAKIHVNSRLTKV
jgi:hypothetical protein